MSFCPNLRLRCVHRWQTCHPLSELKEAFRELSSFFPHVRVTYISNFGGLLIFERGSIFSFYAAPFRSLPLTRPIRLPKN